MAGPRQAETGGPPLPGGRIPVAFRRSRSCAHARPSLNDGPPAISISNDLGTLSPGATFKTAFLGLHETKWFRFTLPVTLNMYLGHYLDIDTESSALAPGNDTEIALYNEDDV